MASKETASDGSRPTIEEFATIEAYCGDVPVYAFGYTYVYGVSPDLMSGAVLQEGNDTPAAKIRPKKSWEIESNYFGLKRLLASYGIKMTRAVTEEETIRVRESGYSEESIIESLATESPRRVAA